MEKRKLVTMHSAILTQIMESEFQLKLRKLLREEQMQKLQKLKLRVSQAFSEKVEPEAEEEKDAGELIKSTVTSAKQEINIRVQE